MGRSSAILAKMEVSKPADLSCFPLTYLFNQSTWLISWVTPIIWHYWTTFLLQDSVYCIQEIITATIMYTYLIQITEEQDGSFSLHISDSCRLWGYIGPRCQRLTAFNISLSFPKMEAPLFPPTPAISPSSWGEKSGWREEVKDISSAPNRVHGRRSMFAGAR